MKRNNTDPPPFSESQILYLDNHLVVINKAARQIVQGDESGDEPLSESIKLYLKNRFQKPGNVFLGVVHRIDRPVSGVVVFARTSKALSRMNELVKQREFSKTYWAIVRNKPPEITGILSDFLWRNEKLNKTFVANATKPGAKEARLKYTLLLSGITLHLVEIQLYTGRHHQIRAQMANHGSPIKGDLKYGDSRSNPDGSICLHSRMAEFVHPVSKESLKIVAPVPDTGDWKIFQST